MKRLLYEASKRKNRCRKGTKKIIIKKKQLLRQTEKLKMGRAPRRDGIQNKAWKYGSERMTERLVGKINGVYVARKVEYIEGERRERKF